LGVDDEINYDFSWAYISPTWFNNFYTLGPPSVRGIINFGWCDVNV